MVTRATVRYQRGAQASAPRQGGPGTRRGFSGLALVIFFVLLILSIALAVFMDLIGVHGGWIAGEVVVL
jgi:hypothetical protein